MKYLCSILFLFFLLILTLDGFSQIDTVLTFSDVEVRAKRIRKVVNNNTSQQWTQKDLEGLGLKNVADLLNNEAGIYIKSYGQGSLASSSIRGGSAGHTLTLWNGLPIHSPMLGLLDMSLLPTQLSDNIELQKGGNTALWGSGAIGGVLSLNNVADFNNRLFIQNQTELASFGGLQEAIKFKIGNAKIQSVTNLSYNKATNDFFYTIAPTLPKRQQSNAALSQQNFLQDFYWKINAKNYLVFHLWQQISDREIPPTIVQNESKAHQDDRATRLIVDWQHIREKTIWQLKTGYFKEHLDYFDDRTGLASLSNFHTFLVDFSNEWSYKANLQGVFGAVYTYTKAQAGGYIVSPEEHKTALFASVKWHRAAWKIQTSVRQTLVNQDFVPLVPMLDITYDPSLLFNFQFKVSKNYRLPTLNDRYWNPGGNSDLRAESGWSQAINLQSKIQQKSFDVFFVLSLYNRVIDDWILWAPKEGQAFWAAHNLTKVWSRGLEPRIDFNYKIGSWKIKWKNGYDYILSTNQIANEIPKLSKGQQLIYTPKHQFFSTATIAWKDLTFSYRHHFTGKSQGVNEALAAFHHGMIHLHYTLLNKRKYKSTLYLKLNNVWNTRYFVVERRPMPGTNYQLGLNIIFNKK